MELKLTNGGYTPSPIDGLKTVSGAQELGQRVLMRLCARRGGFALMPEYGSRLHLLCGARPSRRELTARQYIAEALTQERGLTLENVFLSEPDESGQIDLKADFTYEGEAFSLTAVVGGKI
jgi:hypothetical protein